jgi:NAD(P)-dependent dehydrogenase (short-subunit alcohol dehydrogenase family)
MNCSNETGSLESVSTADWDKVLNTKLRAGFFLAQQLLPQLRAAGDSLIRNRRQ